MQYLALAKGLANRQLVPVNHNIKEIVRKYPKQDWYTSLYRYEDRHLEQFKQTHSLKGITDVKTPRLVFDFDDGENIDVARKDTVEICERLIKIGVDPRSMNIYFSGGKGFHVDVLTDEEFTRQEFVNIVFGLAHDLKTFDTTINDEQRILRVPLSQHQDTKLYKIPLTFDDIKSLTIDEIKDAAKDNEYEVPEPVALKLSDSLQQLKATEFKKMDKGVETEVEFTFDPNSIDWSKCPKWMPKERYALQEGYFLGSQSTSVGQRNTAFMILAATYRNQGFSAEHTLGLLMATSERQAKRTGEDPYTESQMRSEVISQVYSPGWKGGIYAKDEDLLVAIRGHFDIEETDSKTDLVGIDNVGTDFKLFAKDIDRNTVKTGLKSLDDNVLITSGMMVALLAAPGAGKTSFANMFVEHLCQQGEHTLFFSLDMYKNLLFSRLLQRYSGYDMRKILNMYKAEEPDEVLMNAYSDVLKNYSKAQFNFRSGPTVEEIEQEIINYREEKGQNVKLVVVDYLEKVRGPFSDATANSAYIASRLSDIAKKYHTTVLLLVQPQKSAGDPREELTSYRKIKGASVIEQDSRVIMTLSRPGYDPKSMSNDKFATISVVKNNMGNLCQLDFRWDGVSGQVSEMSPADRSELKKLREQIEENKRAQLTGDDITPSYAGNYKNFRNS